MWEGVEPSLSVYCSNQAELSQQKLRVGFEPTTHRVVIVFWKTIKNLQLKLHSKIGYFPVLFTTMVLYRNTQQDLFDIVIQWTYLLLKQIFEIYYAIILRIKILYRKIPIAIGANLQNVDSKSTAYAIPPFLHLSEKQDSNLQPPASKAGKQPIVIFPVICTPYDPDRSGELVFTTRKVAVLTVRRTEHLGVFGNWTLFFRFTVWYFT
jgi:hypothetical protein